MITGLPVCPARAGYGGRTDIGAYEYDTRSGGTATLAYDAAGDLTADGDKGYQYDALGRLTYVASGANTNVALASYRYDALGRLAMRITHDYQQADTDLYDPADTTRYYYYDTPPTSASIANGGRQIPPEVIEVQDDAGDVTDQYVWGPACVDELLIHDKAIDAQTGAPAERLLAVHDRQYSVVAVTDEDGAVVERRTYSPYGADPADPRSGVASVTDADGHRVHPADQATDVMYTGRHYDPTIGENNHRRRYLQHSRGRWDQRDPLGVERTPQQTASPLTQYGDGPNVVAYVAAKPMLKTDPSGLLGGVNPPDFDFAPDLGGAHPSGECKTYPLNSEAIDDDVAKQRARTSDVASVAQVEAHYVLGAGVTKVNCVKNGRLRTMTFAKVCIGGAAGLSGGQGVAALKGCDPSGYEGWFYEAGAAAGPVSAGIDVGYTDQGGLSGTVEGTGGLSLGGAMFKSTWCRYFLISDCYCE